MSLTDAELDDIQRDAESTARLVGAPGSPVRLRAEATVRLVAEVRYLRRVADTALGNLREMRSLCRQAVAELERRGDMTATEHVTREALVCRLRGAGGDP